MNKNLIIAVVVFVGLLVAVLALRGQPAKVGVKELSVEAIERDSVTGFEITIPPKPAKPASAHGGDLTPPPAPGSDQPQNVVLAKDGASWKVWDPAQSDKKLEVEQSLIDAALDAAAEFRTGDLIANKAEKLAELEIDDGKGLRVKIMKQNGKSVELIFGRAAKGGGSTVRLAGSNDVFLAKGRLGPTLKKELLQWRRKSIVAVKPEELVSVSVKLPAGGGFSVQASAAPPAEPTDGGVAVEPKAEWKITEPAALPAGFRLDAAQVARVPQTFTGVRAQDYAEGVTDDAAGLAGPHTVLEASAKDGRKFVMHLGKEDDKKRVYARVDGDPQLYLVAQYAASQASRGLDDLRDFSLTDAKLEDIQRVTIKASSGTLTVARDGDAWKLIEPKVPPPTFDAAQVPTQLAALLRVKATRLATVDAKASGLDKASPTIELTLAGGKKQLIRFGAALPVTADPAVAVVPGSTPEPREYYVGGGVDDLTYVIASFSRKRYDKPLELFKKPPAPMPGMGQPGGMPGGLEGLPPDVRKKLEESLKGAH